MASTSVYVYGNMPSQIYATRESLLPGAVIKAALVLFCTDTDEVQRELSWRPGQACGGGINSDGELPVKDVQQDIA